MTIACSATTAATRRRRCPIPECRSTLGPMTGPPYSGHCLCGGVRFEVMEEPLGAGYCHCTRCQRRTGTAASAQARLAPGSLRLLAGEELVREYAPEDGWPKCFCSVCGSALWSTNP